MDLLTVLVVADYSKAYEQLVEAHSGYPICVKGDTLIDVVV